MAQFGIIYASGSKMIRRIIADSNNLSAHVGPGESLLTVQGDNAPNLFAAQDAVQAETGVKPAWISCAVVDDVGVIKDIVLADPAIDAVPNLNLIPIYDGVTKECAYDAKTELFVAPDVIVKAGDRLNKDGTLAAVDTTISGGPIAKPDTP